MIRRTALLATTLTLVSGAFAEAAGGPAITLKLRPPVVALGHRVDITGRVATHDERPLVLDTARFPFEGGLQKATSGASDNHGFYDFSGHPTLANRVRVRTKDGSAKSRIATVYVLSSLSHKHCSFKTSDGQVLGCHSNQAHGSLTLRFGYRARYPGDAYDEESAKAVYVYYGQRNNSTTHPNTLALQGTVAQKELGKHRTAVNTHVHVDAPQGNWSYYISLCTRSTEKSDGLGIPGHHGCGDQTVTYRQARSYKFG